MKKLVSAILVPMLFLSYIWYAMAAYTPSIKEVEAANFLLDLDIISHPVMDGEDITIDDIREVLKNMIDDWYWEDTLHQINLLVQLYRLWDAITRQEVMKIIAKISEETMVDTCRWDFDDVKTWWGCKYIEWALDKWYIAKNSTFRPNDNITKTEAMKLILKVKGISKVTETDNWQKDYADTALEYDIVEEAYSDYNADAYRGWLFVIATATIEKEEEIKVKIEKKKELMSDEVTP